MFSLVGLLGLKKKIFFYLILSSIFPSLLEIIGWIIKMGFKFIDNTFYLKFNEYSIKYDVKGLQVKVFYFCIILLHYLFLKIYFYFFFIKLKLI